MEICVARERERENFPPHNGKISVARERERDVTRGEEENFPPHNGKI